MDIASPGLDGGHGGLLDYAADQPSATPGHQQIDMTACLHQGLGPIATVSVHGSHQSRIQPLLTKHPAYQFHQGAVGALGRVTSPQEGRIAGLEAEGHHIDGDIGPGLVDHGHHAQGNPHLIEPHAVGHVMAANHLAQGIGQPRHHAHAPGGVRDTNLVQAQTVDQTGAHSFFKSLGAVLLIDCGNLIGLIDQRISQGQQQSVPGLAGQACQTCLCSGRRIGHGANPIEHILTIGVLVFTHVRQILSPSRVRQTHILYRL